MSLWSCQLPIVCASLLIALAEAASAEGVTGYYREPAIHRETVVFCAEEDFWIVGAAGGVARRLTSHLGAESDPAISSWTPDGRVLCASGRYSGLPDQQLVSIDPATSRVEIVPLHQASEGTVDERGALYFTRYGANFSFTKRYRGGLAQDL